MDTASDASADIARLPGRGITLRDASACAGELERPPRYGQYQPTVGYEHNSNWHCTHSDWLARGLRLLFADVAS